MPLSVGTPKEKREAVEVSLFTYRFGFRRKAAEGLYSFGKEVSKTLRQLSEKKGTGLVLSTLYRRNRATAFRR